MQVSNNTCIEANHKSTEYNTYHLIRQAEVELMNEPLWQKFHGFGNEMILTKTGRRMFPTIECKVRNLNPTEYYSIALEVMPFDRCRYKYSASSGWSAASGSEELPGQTRIFNHPQSPSTGSYWMSQNISFSRLKLTNTNSINSTEHIILCSMHKYIVKVHITLASHYLQPAPSKTVVFPETAFIAVTAYQNEKITQLKIDNNPFAKGFRESGQAKCKRKHVEEPSEKVVERPKRNGSTGSSPDSSKSGGSNALSTSPECCPAGPSSSSSSSSSGEPYIYRGFYPVQTSPSVNWFPRPVPQFLYPPFYTTYPPIYPPYTSLPPVPPQIRYLPYVYTEHEPSPAHISNSNSHGSRPVSFSLNCVLALGTGVNTASAEATPPTNHSQAENPDGDSDDESIDVIGDEEPVNLAPQGVNVVERHFTDFSVQAILQKN